jgi:CPA1 family monovalent cation:H+ antiporter
MVIFLIFIASLVGIAVQRLRMPYTVGLVLVGLGLAVFSLQYAEAITEVINLNAIRLPEVILTILVPPLIFEAAFHIKFENLRRNLKEILTLAIPGVLITMVLVGLFITWGTDLPLEVALIFGALIAATDPVAVVALFRTLKVPNQLLIMLEGESLLNDGVAILIFNLMIAITLGISDFSVAAFVQDFILIAGGGLVIGLIVAGAASLIISQVNNHLIEVTLTTVTAYGAYLVAEELHVSGVLAVVAAGLVIGNLGERGMSPTTKISLFNFWEFSAYLANSIAFLLIGLVIDISQLLSSMQSILIAIVAVLVARAIVIYLLSFRFSNITSNMRHVLYWGGLRGAISLALALSLPDALGGETQSLLQDMTFGVVLFTLLVQGTTMRPILKRLGFSTQSKNQVSYERHQARAIAAQRSHDRLLEMHREGLVSDHAWNILEPAIQRQIELRKEVVQEILHADRTVGDTELDQAFQEILRSQRSTYNSLLSEGMIGEETFAYLVNEVDAALINQDISYGDLLLRRTKDLPPITKLVFASVSEPDVFETLHMLGIMGIPAIRLASNLGPSGQISLTLLIGVEEEQLDEVIEAIMNCCSPEQPIRRGLFNLLPGQEPKEDGQPDHANVYVFDVEHYEEI